MAKSSKNTKSRTRSAGSVSKRTQTVWASLVAAMTVVMGGLFLLSPKNKANASGLTLTPLMATAAPDTVEVILNTNRPLIKGQWRYIVIDATGTSFDTTKDLDDRARTAGLTGLGHHFIIGNGNGLRDGELVIGQRWMNQQPGAHTVGQTTNAQALNANGIGITLVGNGEKHEFTPAQMQRLNQLIATLRRETGIPASSVYLHQEVAPINRPGKLFPAAAFKAQLR